MTPVDQGRAAARARHPSTRNPLPASVMRARITERFRSAGIPHADVAAALLQARGVDGADEERFARRLGVDVRLLRQAEAGGIALRDLPPTVRVVVAFSQP